MNALIKGDIVRIERKVAGSPDWSNVTCVVRDVYSQSANLQPLTQRPDGYDLQPFNWTLDELVRIHRPNDAADELESLRSQLMTTQTNLEEARRYQTVLAQRFEEKMRTAVAAAAEYARDNNWCEEFYNACAAADIEEYVPLKTFTYETTVTITVDAWNADQAADKVNEIIEANDCYIPDAEPYELTEGENY